MNNYHLIPEELRALKQWVVHDKDKVPYDAKTNALASVNNSSDWVDVDTAISAASKYSGIGFVFTANDPYSFIDLDDTKGDQVAFERQLKIFNEFDSYSEISPSGRGLHIIVKGNVPAGRRRSHIEIYNSQRYATFTGNIYPQGSPRPIRDYQDKLMALWEQMGSGPNANIYTGDEQEKYSDEEIIRQATAAVNGDKFCKLFAGEWNTEYPSQSEADFAIIDILAFYTQNHNQIRRLFRSSNLGKRNKAHRADYLSWMINKSFDRMLPPIDFDGFHNQLELKLAKADNIIQAQAPIPDFPASYAPLNPPPGLLGEIARFIYDAAPLPVPEIAIAGAIAIMAGICGKAYNVRGTGLNQYVLLLAKTGRGKDAVAYGADKLFGSIRLHVPTSSRFRGPSAINSGQALIKHLSRASDCFVSILGEFGITIARISDKRANSADRELLRALLELYQRSGKGQTLPPSIYSKAEDNTNTVIAPAVTIFGESNPRTFYEALTENLISQGVLPRFLTIEYLGKRVDENENAHLVEPSFNLIEKFGTLVANIESTLRLSKVIEVQIEPEADELLKSYGKYATDKINSSDDNVIEELWNRARLKVRRLAALVAVGVNQAMPTITVEHFHWARNLVDLDINRLSKKFEKGEVGINTEELKQQVDIARIVKDYVSKDWEWASKYIQEQKLHHVKIIPYAYLNKRLSNIISFKSDRLGATAAIKRAIQTLVDSDKLRELPKQDIAKYGTSQKCYVVSNTTLLDDPAAVS